MRAADLDAVAQVARFLPAVRPRFATDYLRALRHLDRRALARVGAQAGPHAGRKYLRHRAYLARAVLYAHRCGLHRSAPLDVLDLGTGAGYFLHVCRELGHRPLGLDVDDPFYGALLRAVRVERVTAPIRPFEPLPVAGRRFDLVTAFAVCFNGHDTPQLWDVAEWRFFLDDLTARILVSGGRVVLQLNRERAGFFATPSLQRFFASRGAAIDRDWIELRAR